MQETALTAVQCNTFVHTLSWCELARHASLLFSHEAKALNDIFPNSAVDAGVLQVKEGDTVLYFKYAGETMETPEGKQYIVVHEQDVLCKA